ncbi:MAG TPA: XdhC/CoxI family protein [Afifellaceae bacterium]|nr:XdhC/CoxI family protein [Afifellaceae bacterium]
MNGTVTRVLDLIDRLRHSGEDFCVVTVLRTAAATSAKAGAKAVVTGDGTVHGFIGGGCVQGAVLRVGLEAIEGGEPRLIRVKPKEDVVEPVDVDGIELHKSACPSGGTVDLFFEPMRQAPRIVICGTSPVALTLARLSDAMGYHAMVAAPQADLDQLEDKCRTWPGYDLDELKIGGRDAIVVATQGRRDREALKSALMSAAGYIGMVGSRTKIGKLTDQLRAEVPAERIAGLHGPAGLAIGAIDPEEIALSILGEIVQERRSAVKRGVADIEAI